MHAGRSDKCGMDLAAAVAGCKRVDEKLFSRSRLGGGQRRVCTSKGIGSSNAGNTSALGVILRPDFLRLDVFTPLSSFKPVGKFHHPTLLVSYTIDCFRFPADGVSPSVDVLSSSEINIVFELPLIPSFSPENRAFQL